MRPFYTIALLTGSIAVYADSIPSDISSRIAAYNDPMHTMAVQSYHNPVIRQWMLPISYSTLLGRYRNDRQSETIDPQLGDGSDYWSFEADSYMKYRSSTLWGAASYKNGHQRNVQWNETSDADLVYPYFTADAVGGDMNAEIYSFSGGYADTSNRLAWGAELSYTAGLYYRGVDPRPRNVTGRLDAAAGIGYRITGDYYISASVNYRKYKQSNDIDFKSQMGVEKIYHTTGLGSHYNRFAGNGTSTYYNGNRYGLSLNLYPSSSQGFAIAVDINRFSFDNVLTDLNKLPMAHAWHNAIQTQAAWLHRGVTNDFSLNVGFDAYRRHGTENIFGDPAGNIYPQIGAIDMYADNRYAFALSALWQHRWKNRHSIWIKPSIGYANRDIIYVQPASEILVSDINTSITANGSLEMPRHWRISLTVSGSLRCPTESSMLLENTISPEGLIDVERQRFFFLEHSDWSFESSIQASKGITQNYALMLSGTYRRGFYRENVHSDLFDVSLSFIF